MNLNRFDMKCSDEFVLIFCLALLEEKDFTLLNLLLASRWALVLVMIALAAGQI